MTGEFHRDRESANHAAKATLTAWLEEQAEAEWDAQIEKDEKAGKFDALAERALAEHRAGRPRQL